MTATIIREAITLMREKILTDRYAKRLGRD